MTQPSSYEPPLVPQSQQAPVWTAGPQMPVVPGRRPVAMGLAMKQRHPVTVWLLWPFLTLGIYSLVWYYKIHKEMAEFDRRRAVPVAGPMLVLLFLSWTFVAPMVSYYNCGTRIRKAQRAAGLPETCSPAGGMLLMLVFGVGVLYYQIELNKIVESYGVPEGRQIPLYV
ncbi:DUF4234 domain-containing protein [Amycolatopsis acidiphila]|uniref:DUF4234 domain-containing protein n=1 Tax=Amycolatopsis acidiphila TaxID=715473 RepID=A0A558A8V0_9PSEU|nr:DUF4234 domain-containing protein [Amycolatopsis acidiphila]TVT20689.1 DUF4234 domain-containing protein [Amycolatopsis acidiphila]UIJ58988.1 DUF4234 domain-containing protein [Amycolatopsis acidiphila]GHG73187.1 hypothetical protein GCM10017788_36340 [Amycolatopsis acidiphila]